MHHQKVKSLLWRQEGQQTVNPVTLQLQTNRRPGVGRFIVTPWCLCPQSCCLAESQCGRRLSWYWKPLTLLWLQFDCAVHLVVTSHVSSCFPGTMLHSVTLRELTVLHMICIGTGSCHFVFEDDCPRHAECAWPQRHQLTLLCSQCLSAMELHLKHMIVHDLNLLSKAAFS